MKIGSVITKQTLTISDQDLDSVQNNPEAYHFFTVSKGKLEPEGCTSHAFLEIKFNAYQTNGHYFVLSAKAIGCVVAEKVIKTKF